MDDKTEELRDIFLSVSDEETVTESQTADRGSVADTTDDIDERLQSVVSEMCEEFTFRTSLDAETLAEVVQLFYDGCPDEEIADTLSTDSETVFYARMDMHLVHEDEPRGIDDATVEAVRDGYASGEDPETIAADCDHDVESIERTWTVIESRNRARRVSNRYRTAFEEILTDADLTVQFTADAHEDGLDDATAGAEVDVEF